MSNDIRKGWSSASNALADSLCPGRHLAQVGIPEPERGEDASMGSRIHEALAGVPLATEKLSLTEREMFDSCREIERKVVHAFFGNEPKGLRVWRHERLWCKVPPEKTIEHSGEPDVVFKQGTRALILDYKVLAGDVADASSNQQLRDLAVMVRANYVPLTEVATAIIQPLVTHSPEIALYQDADLMKACKEMFARIRASNNPQSVRVAGEMQCKFCKASKSCPEYIQWQGKALSSLAETRGEIELFKVAMVSWSPDQWADALALIQRGAKFFTIVKDEAKGRLAADPASIPGWGLKEGATKEAITNPQELFNRFAAIGGKLEAFLPCVTVGKTKFKEAVNAATEEKGKALNATLAKLYEGIVDVSHNEPSLKKVGEA